MFQYVSIKHIWMLGPVRYLVGLPIIDSEFLIVCRKISTFDTKY